jgi:toxin ParE1/3/4
VAYRVRLTSRAARDLELLYDSIRAADSAKAFEWFNALAQTIYSLDRFPERGALTPEGRLERQLLFGRKPHTYRIIYEIDKRNHIVRISHIRHCARAPQKSDRRNPIGYRDALHPTLTTALEGYAASFEQYHSTNAIDIVNN